MVMPSLRRALRQRLQQQRPEAPFPPVVGDGDGGLREPRPVAQPDEARDSHTAAGDGVERRQRLVIVMVDLGEVAQLRLAELRQRGEEAAIARLRAQTREALGQERLVRRLDGP